MKIFYLDPGLVGHLGHQANYCRHITTELRSRHLEVWVYGHCRIVPELQDELQVKPLFRHHTYYNDYAPTPRVDPMAVWLAYFETTWITTRSDLDEVNGLREAQIVYLSSATAPQLMAAVQWLSSLPVSKRPRMVVELGIGAPNGSGDLCPRWNVSRSAAADSLEILEIADVGSFLYRYVGMYLHKALIPDLKIATFHSATSKAYERLLRYPVEVFPFPHSSIVTGRVRSSGGPLTVSVLGHQRLDKGFQIVPSWAALLLDQRPDIRVLIHNGAPHLMANEQNALRELAMRNPRLVLNESVAGPELWSTLLCESDLIVCPYYPEAFATKHSAVVAEAIANGIPVVVPGRTCLASLLSAYGFPGVTFAEFGVESVLQATIAAIDDFERLAHVSQAASQQWQCEQGARPLVHAILGQLAQ